MPKNLKERMMQATAAAAPSMDAVTTADPKGPPPKEEPTTPKLAELVKSQKERLLIARLVQEHGELGQEMSVAKKRREALAKLLKPLLGEFKVGKALSGDWVINYFAQDRYTLNKNRLIALGVTAQVLTEATDHKTISTLKISPVGKEDVKEEEEE